MKFNSFEDIIAWQEAKKLTLSIYKTFKLIKDYSFKDQIQRASLSVMNNIAEGYERQGNKEFKKFLFIAKGSSAEVRSMLYIAIKLGCIDEATFNNLYDKSLRVSKILSGLIKSIT